MNPSQNMSSDQMQITLPSNLMAQIDAQVGAEFADREDFLRAAARFSLDHLRDRGGEQAQMRG